MADATFEKLTQNGENLFGPRKLLLCGFPASAQAKFMVLLKMVGLRKIYTVWPTAADTQQSVAELFEAPDRTGWGVDSELPRAVIVAGISQGELYQLMNGAKHSGMQTALWATLTPTSAQWTLAQLLEELETEKQALSKKK